MQFRWIALWCLLGIPALMLAQTPPAGFVVFKGTRVVDGQGNPSSGTLCAQVTAAPPVGTNSTKAYSVQVGGGGATTKPPVCTNINSGAFTMFLPNTSLTVPLNACIALSATDNISGDPLLDVGYGCLQPGSSNSNSWCSSSGGIVTCNLDQYPPNLPAIATVQQGPVGPAGPTGTTGPPGGSLSYPGVTSDGANGLLVSGGLKSGSNENFGVSTASSLLAQVTSCGSLTCVIFITGNVGITGNYTFPSDSITLVFAGGMLQPANGIVLNMNGVKIVAPVAQIFGGTGTIVGLSESRPEYFGSSGTVAVAAAALAPGGKVILGNSVYQSGMTTGTPLVKSNLSVEGVGQAAYDSMTAPTKFVAGSGTIIQGTVSIRGSSLRFRQLSIDVGPALGTCEDGLTESSQGIGNPNLRDIAIDHVSTLLCSSTSAYHSILMEGVYGGSVSNVQTFYGIYGTVFKCQHCTGNHIVSRAHASNCALVKSDNLFAIAAYVDVDDVRCTGINTGDTGPVQILGAAALAQKITLRNVKATNMNGQGIEVYAFALGGVPGTVADSEIINPIVDTVSGTGIQTITDSTSLITRLVISNPIVNNVSTAIQLGQYGNGISVSNAMLTNVASLGVDNFASNSSFLNTSCANVTGYCVYSRGGFGSFLGITVQPPGSGIAAGPAFGSDTGIVTPSVEGNFLAGSAPAVSTSSIFQGSGSTTVTAAGTAATFSGTGVGSGMLRLRDSTNGGSALFLVDPNAGAQLVGTSQITGITAASAITQVSANWAVTLSAGTFPRVIQWTLYE